MKVCRKCGVEKIPTAFTPNPKLKDGLHSWCKECMKSYWRKKYHNDKEFRERRVARVRKWEKDNSEHFKEWYRGYQRVYQNAYYHAGKRKPKPF